MKGLSIDHATYVVWADYGLEGWKPWAGTMTFIEAWNFREEAIRYGNQDVRIFKAVNVDVKEKQGDQ